MKYTHDITHINDLLSKLYAKIKLPKFTSFGQDVFGNQFVIKDEILGVSHFCKKKFENMRKVL